MKVAKYFLGILTVLTFLLLAGLWLWFPEKQQRETYSYQPEQPQSVTPVEIHQAIKRMQHAMDSTAEQSFESAVAETSLEGTEPPGTFVFQNGQLQKNEHCRAIFEYFLAVSGELTQEQIESLLLRSAGKDLTDTQLLQIMTAFTEYQGYLEYMRTGENLYQDLSPAQALEQIRQMRREFFGYQQAQQYFAYEENYDRYQVERMRLLGDDQLTESERQSQLAQLVSQLPEDLRERQQHTLEIRRQLSQWQKANQAEDAFAMEQKLSSFPPETRQRLLDLQAEREDWQQRYDAYAEEVQRLDTSGLSATDREAEITRTRQRHFSDSELARVAAWDRMAEQRP